MITINYNDKEYIVDDLAPFSKLLEREQLLELPLSKWKELLIKKNGRVKISLVGEVLLKKIEKYDVSDNVNSFVFKGMQTWLDKNTRVGLMNLANCSDEDVQVVLNGNIVTLPANVLKQYLAALERYAAKCYLVTQQHLIAAKQLKTIDEIVNYDYTSGYPEKLIID